MTAPTLTPRAAREQATFRALLNAMSHPGSVYELEVRDVSPLVAIAEALVDHEVTFAVQTAEAPDLAETILRQTGSRIAPVAYAKYVFCDGASLEAVAREVTDGSWEYPDAGATVVCRVRGFDQVAGAPMKMVASGPGIRGETELSVDGIAKEAVDALQERNAARPMGIDLVLVAPDGKVAAFTRYTRLEEG
jgi:alpha-D-ribose 1-methylphosphonate 5-triphosphate synthase subunit PhnH